MNDAAPAFSQLMTRYKEAVLEKDGEKFIALYEDDIHVFDMWGTWSVRGLLAWRKMTTEWFSSLGDERVVVDVDEVETVEMGELAIGHAVLTFTAFCSGGNTLRSLNNRISAGLRKKDGVWRIFHEHTSVPINPENLNALLVRAKTP